MKLHTRLSHKAYLKSQRSLRFAAHILICLGIFVSLGRPQSANALKAPAQIAYTVEIDEHHSAIYLIDADGKNQRQLTDGTDSSFLGSWSPDGKQIVFESDRDQHFGIYVMDAGGKNLSELRTLLPYPIEPLWSPDGRYIAFVTQQGENSDIYLIDVKTKSVMPLVNNPAADYFGSWSPDSKHLAFYSWRGGSVNFYVTPIDKEMPVQLTSKIRIDPLSQPTWSPDGKQIAFVGQMIDPADPYGARTPDNLYIMDIDGSSLINLTQILDEDMPIAPTWSPDGESIALVYIAHSVGVSIDKIDVTTKKRVKLKDITQSCRYLAWSPDGQQIACVTGGGQEPQDIFVMNADGSDLHQVTFSHKVNLGGNVPGIQWRPQ